MKGNKQMKRRILSVVAALAAAGATASDLFVPSGSVTTNFVAEGASVTHEGRLAVASDGLLAKTGGGEWTVPGASLCQYWPFSATVCDGTLALAAGGTEPENEVPAVLRDEATVWLSMKDPNAAHFEKSGNSLLRWYDVREDLSHRTRFCAKADFTYAPAGSYPQVTEKDGFPCVYFGGVGSGVAMSLRNTTDDETMADVNAFHLFAVVCHDTSLGVIFGSGGPRGNMFMSSVSATSLNIPYADPLRLWPSTTRGTTYVDGERFDPYKSVPPKGRFHLFDSGSPVKGPFAALFGQWGSKKWWGGDYLAEAIVFSRELTPVERLQVQSYLAKKWFSGMTVAKTVRIDEGATLDAGDFRNLTVAGDGKVVKSGVATASYRVPSAFSSEAVHFNGRLEIAEGDMNLSTRLPLEVAAGTAITTGTTEGGDLNVATSAATSGTLVKTGEGDVAIAGLPSGVTELNVTAGTLEIDRGMTDRTEREESFYVPIENPGFETFATEEEWTTTYGRIIPTSTDAGTYTNGWRRSVNQTWMLNWRILPREWKSSNNLTHQPHDGDVVAMIHQNCILATPVSIPKVGTYELAFDVCGREEDTYLGAYVKCTLNKKDANGTVVADFGRGYFYEFGYRRVKLRATVSTSGDYELQFRDINIENSPTIIDNVSLRYVPACEDEELAWAVPNGGFEYDQDLTGSDNRKYVVESPFANWTFDAGAAGTVAVVTAASTNGVDGEIGVEYNPSRGPAGGFRQLLMKGNACSATVTCTPAKGTYYLRADLGRYYAYLGQCTASVRIGDGASVDLGTFVVANSVMQAFTWEKPFEVSGADSVSITFAFARNQIADSAKTGIWLDDVRLVSYDDREFVANGGFETSSKVLVNWADGWLALTNHPAARLPFAQVQPYSFRPDWFTADPIESNFFLYIQCTGGAAHPVTFDHAGLYRLSFYAAYSNLGASGDPKYAASTPVRAWLAQGAKTNEIGRTGAILTTKFCQHVWTFRVREPGEYLLGLQGTSTVKDCCNVCVDAVSIRRVDERRYAERENAPLFGEKTKVSVAAGAQLRVDFEGTNKIDELRLGGHRVKGYIDVADWPEYLSGRGCFFVKPRRGLSLIVK